MALLVGVMVGFFLPHGSNKPSVVPARTYSCLLITDYRANKTVKVENQAEIIALFEAFAQQPKSDGGVVDLRFPYQLQFYREATCSGIVYYDASGFYRTDLVLQHGDDRLEAQLNNTVLNRVKSLLKAK